MKKILFAVIAVVLALVLTAFVVVRTDNVHAEEETMIETEPTTVSIDDYDYYHDDRVRWEYTVDYQNDDLDIYVCVGDAYFGDYYVLHDEVFQTGDDMAVVFRGTVVGEDDYNFEVEWAGTAYDEYGYEVPEFDYMVKYTDMKMNSVLMMMDLNGK